jgi:hypothetical protein
MKQNLPTGALESKVDRIDVERVRNARSNARKKKNQRSITSTQRCMRIWSFNKRSHFASR